eukprot:TRINITY_DN21222_c4_g1_i1.p1 TRINITY_DN21222_c4_g1~~TRINITY_DN21222_c4_g1_i1.p1  ORF type:complete len:1578 (-),score=572.84 TRINITY_DN21222_c4_g1_i1:45-4778(-)
MVGVSWLGVLLVLETVQCLRLGDEDGDTLRDLLKPALTKSAIEADLKKALEKVKHDEKKPNESQKASLESKVSQRSGGQPAAPGVGGLSELGLRHDDGAKTVSRAAARKDAVAGGAATASPSAAAVGSNGSKSMPPPSLGEQQASSTRSSSIHAQASEGKVAAKAKEVSGQLQHLQWSLKNKMKALRSKAEEVKSTFDGVREADEKIQVSMLPPRDSDYSEGYDYDSPAGSASAAHADAADTLSHAKGGGLGLIGGDRKEKIERPTNLASLAQAAPARSRPAARLKQPATPSPTAAPSTDPPVEIAPLSPATTALLEAADRQRDQRISDLESSLRLEQAHDSALQAQLESMKAILKESLAAEVRSSSAAQAAVANARKATSQAQEQIEGLRGQVGTMQADEKNLKTGVVAQKGALDSLAQGLTEVKSKAEGQVSKAELDSLKQVLEMLKDQDASEMADLGAQKASLSGLLQNFGALNATVASTSEQAAGSANKALVDGLVQQMAEMKRSSTQVASEAEVQKLQQDLNRLGQASAAKVQMQTLVSAVQKMQDDLDHTMSEVESLSTTKDSLDGLATASLSAQEALKSIRTELASQHAAQDELKALHSEVKSISTSQASIEKLRSDVKKVSEKFKVSVDEMRKMVKSKLKVELKAQVKKEMEDTKEQAPPDPATVETTEAQPVTAKAETQPPTTAGGAAKPAAPATPGGDAKPAVAAAPVAADAAAALETKQAATTTPVAAAAAAAAGSAKLAAALETRQATAAPLAARAAAVAVGSELKLAAAPPGMKLVAVPVTAPGVAVQPMEAASGAAATAEGKAPATGAASAGPAANGGAAAEGKAAPVESTLRAVARRLPAAEAVGSAEAGSQVKAAPPGPAPTVMFVKSVGAGPAAPPAATKPANAVLLTTQAQTRSQPEDVWEEVEEEEEDERLLAEAPSVLQGEEASSDDSGGGVDDGPNPASGSAAPTQLTPQELAQKELAQKQIATQSKGADALHTAAVAQDSAKKTDELARELRAAEASQDPLVKKNAEDHMAKETAAAQAVPPGGEERLRGPDGKVLEPAERQDITESDLAKLGKPPRPGSFEELRSQLQMSLSMMRAGMPTQEDLSCLKNELLQQMQTYQQGQGGGGSGAAAGQELQSLQRDVENIKRAQADFERSLAEIQRRELEEGEQLRRMQEALSSSKPMSLPAANLVEANAVESLAAISQPVALAAPGGQPADSAFATTVGSPAAASSGAVSAAETSPVSSPLSAVGNLVESRSTVNLGEAAAVAAAAETGSADGVRAASEAEATGVASASVAGSSAASGSSAGASVDLQEEVAGQQPADSAAAYPEEDDGSWPLLVVQSAADAATGGAAGTSPSAAGAAGAGAAGGGAAAAAVVAAEAPYRGFDGSSADDVAASQRAAATAGVAALAESPKPPSEPHRSDVGTSVATPSSDGPASLQTPAARAPEADAALAQGEAAPAIAAQANAAPVPAASALPAVNLGEDGEASLVAESAAGVAAADPAAAERGAALAEAPIADAASGAPPAAGSAAADSAVDVGGVVNVPTAAAAAASSDLLAAPTHKVWLGESLS